MKKETKRKIILGMKMLLMLVLLVLFTALVIYARKQEQNIICHEIDVHIKNGNEWKFLNEQDILAFINNNRGKARHSLSQWHSEAYMKREDIPKHLRHLTKEKLKALFYLFRKPV